MQNHFAHFINNNQGAKSIYEATSSFLKQLNSHSSRWIPLLFSVITISLIIWFTVYEVTWNRIRISVSVSPDYLQVISTRSNSGYLQGYLNECDRIMAIGDLPVKELLSNRINPDQTIFVNSLEDVLTVPIDQSLKEGQRVQFWSTNATTLTFDISGCSNVKEQLSNSDRIQLLQCQTCFITTDNLNIDPKNTNASLVKLNLSQLKLYSNDYIGIIILTLLTLSYCAIGSFFFILRSDREVIAIHSLFLHSSALALLVHNSTYYHLSQLEIIVQIISFQLVAVFFLHFVLLFPDGNPLSRKGIKFVTYSYVIVGLITASELYLNVFNTNQTDFAELRTLSRICRFGDFTVLFGTALIVIGLKYVRSKNEEKLRIRLAIISLTFSVSVPFLGFVFNAFFGLFQDWIEERFPFLLLPSLLIPLFFTYALVKNRLFGVTITIRRIVTYTIVLATIFIVYYSVSIGLTLLLPFGIGKQSENISFFTILFLVVLTELVHLTFNRVHKFVDQKFSVDPLNHQALNRYWIREIAKIHDPNELCLKITQQLTEDYHYKNTSLLLCQPDTISLLIGQLQNTDYSGINFTSAQHQSLIECILVSSNGKEIKNVSTEFLSSLKHQEWVLARDEKLTIEVAAYLRGIQNTPIEVAFPLLLGDDLYGALLMGEKKSEYSPPPSDELEQLRVIANQISASLHTSTLLAQAHVLAEKEKQLRLDSEARTRREQQIRQQTLSSVAEALHGETLQELFVLRQKLEQTQQVFENSTKPDFSVLNQLIYSIDSTIKEFRVITAELRLLGENESFIDAIKRLISAFQSKHTDRQINLDLQLDEDETKFELVLNEQLKLSLFRSTQEAINNALKHSKASVIDISLELSQTCRIMNNDSYESVYLLEIQVVDNGIGVSKELLNRLNSTVSDSSEDFEEGRHLGIKIIRQQIDQYADKYNSQINFYSSPGSGFQVAIALYLPLHEDDLPITSKLESSSLSILDEGQKVSTFNSSFLSGSLILTDK
ncbi:MAG TPA: ATP-binding protein [Chloroflexia bacterium]|nr:ATP-binding protein [Chloroflexia bacterium]